MNLSRRAKLDREGGTRGTARKAPPVADPAAEASPVSPADVPAPPAAVPVAAEVVVEAVPKRARYVRAAAEVRPAARPAPVVPRSTKQSGKMMTKNVASAPAGPGAAAQNKGPKAGREPIVNDRPRS